MGNTDTRAETPIKVEILTIGDELLRGELVDTNSAWLAARLHEQGLELGAMSSVGDGVDQIVAAVRGAVSRRAAALVVSGGLGPTDDDRTTAAVAEAAGLPLERSAAALETIAKRFRAVGLELTPNNEKQADFPRGAAIIDNRAGTAPGFALDVDGCRIICLPGVPRELRRMYDEAVGPALIARLGARPAVVRRYKVFGLAEAQVDHRLVGLLETVDRGGCEVSVHYRATFPEIHVTIIVRGDDPGGAASVADALEVEALARLGHYLFATGETTFAEAVVARLREAGATLALAESCTGGLAGDLITNAAGSSDVFLLSAVTYHNDAKRKVLGVPAEVLATDGAVSQTCVEAMARGVRELAGSSYGVSISGIAGPGGGSPEKPVGTVHFALVGPRGERHVQRVFGYDRRRIKQLAAHVALWLVYRELCTGATPENADLLGGRWQPTAGRQGDTR